MRPDGRVLQWKSFGVLENLAANGADPVPFFIEWSRESVHPSQDSPKCGELQSPEITPPDPAAVTATLELLGLEAKVLPGARCSLRATLITSKGPVTLG